MNKTMMRVSALALAVLMIVSALPMMTETTYAAKDKAIGKSSKKVDYKNWNPEVKNALNAMIKKYGKGTKKYNKKKPPYVVFDFDNTCSIFDVEEQLAIYQLQTMSFAKTVTPAKLPNILKTGLAKEYFTKALGKDADFGKVTATYQDWIDDIVAAYKVLYKKYGPFKPTGLSAAKQKAIQKTDAWKEFAAKMRAMYDVVYNIESPAVAYPWVLYWFTGMTETQVYNLARKSHAKYKKVNTTEEMWATPASYNSKSKVGEVQAEWTSGTAVSRNIADLMQAFDKNGIKVWVCSASATDPIRAAIDEFGLHRYVTGVLAMTNKLKKGKYVNQYDYKTGRAWKPVNKSKAQKKLSAKDWKKYKKYATKAQTQGEGKVISINNVPRKMYKHGPIAGFMDSTGDFNFCTEYKSLKVVVCFNRASRKTTDGGGLIAELAVYQADDLKLNFAKADKAGDTLYVLQGRQENKKRALRPSRKTILVGDSSDKLWRDKEDDEKWHEGLDEKYVKEIKKNDDGADYQVYKGNTYQYDYMKAHKLTTKQVINKFAPKTKAADAGDYGLKFGCVDTSEKMKTGSGMVKQWRGYHKLS